MVLALKNETSGTNFATTKGQLKISMNLSLEIFYFSNYEIHKQFRCYMPHLAGYLIRKIGLDGGAPGSKILPHKDSVYRKPNEKFLLLIRELPKRKSRRKHKANKYEFTDPI